MVATKTRKPKHRRKSGSNDVQGSSRVRSAKVARDSTNEAEVATQGAWNAVKASRQFGQDSASDSRAGNRKSDAERG